MAKLRHLQLGPGQTKPFTFTHTKRSGAVEEVTVLLRALTQWDINLARANAPRTMKDLAADLKEGRAYEELLETATTIEILGVALRDADPDTDSPWATPLELAQILHPGAIAALSRAWEEHQEACSPLKGDLTPAAYDALVEVIAKEASADPLLLFASPLRNACITTMAREALAYRMAKSSPSSESSSDSSDSENPSQRSQAADEADRRELITEAMTEIAVLRDDVASLKIRCMHLEADTLRGAAPAPA